jgi:hypothetical protein
MFFLFRPGVPTLFYGSSLFQMGEYFEILAAPVDPGRIRKRSRKR